MNRCWHWIRNCFCGPSNTRLGTNNSKVKIYGEVDRTRTYTWNLKVNQINSPVSWNARYIIAKFNQMSHPQRIVNFSAEHDSDEREDLAINYNWLKFGRLSIYDVNHKLIWHHITYLCDKTKITITLRPPELFNQTTVCTWWSQKSLV